MCNADLQKSSLQPKVQNVEEDKVTTDSSVSSSLSDISTNDPFGLLQSKHIAAAATAAAAAALATSKINRKRPRLHKSEELKRQERLVANRKSASDSRKRQKAFISNLQDSVSQLLKKNADLVLENDDLKLQLSEMRRLYGQKEVVASMRCLQGSRFRNGTSLPNPLCSLKYLQQHRLPQLSTNTALLRDLIRSHNMPSNKCSDSTASRSTLSFQANPVQGITLTRNVLREHNLQYNSTQQQNDNVTASDKSLLEMVLQRQFQTMTGSGNPLQARERFS